MRSLLEYAFTVWDPFTYVNIMKLESVQRRSAKFVMNDYRQRSSVTSMLNTLQWQPLADRRTICKAVMMYRIVNGLVAKPPLELHTTSHVARCHIARSLSNVPEIQPTGISSTQTVYGYVTAFYNHWWIAPLNAFTQGVLNCSIP